MELLTLTSLALLVVPFLPATNVLFYVGFVVAERILYIPSMGFCIFIGFCFGQLLKRTTKNLSKLLSIGLLLTFVILALKTLLRNGDWRNEESLYRAGVRVNPPKGNFFPISFTVLLDDFGVVFDFQNVKKLD